MEVVRRTPLKCDHAFGSIEKPSIRWVYTQADSITVALP